MFFSQSHEHEDHNDHTHQLDHSEVSHDHHESDGHSDHGETPPGWTVIPFVLLLMMIATGPLFYPHFWHKSYPIIALILGSLVVGYYLFVLHNTHSPIHSLAEYIQFIALISGLFVASGGILIIIDKKASPKMNVILLAIGAVLANIIKTTGASMLLIRPFIRLNKNEI